MYDTAHVRTTHRGRLLTVEVLSGTDASGRTVEREVVRHPGAVLLLPVLDDGRIVLIRNDRIAVDKRLHELPAGTMETGESPAMTASRELTEETGYVAGRMSRLGGFYTTPGFCDEWIEVFVADELREQGQRLDPGESITVDPVAFDEALAMIDDGRIVDAKSIAAILMWSRRSRGGST